MGGERLFHFVGARFERLQQVAMAPLKIFEDFGQLGRGAAPRYRKRENAIDGNMVRPRLVSRVEIPRFGRGLEWTHDNSSRIRAQIESLPIQESDL